MYKQKSLIGVGTLLSLTLLSGAVLSAPLASADTSGTVDVTVSINAACTLTPNSTSLTQTIAPGTPGNIGTANLKAVCNDAEGFAIYAVGYTNNEYGNTDLITELGTNYSIHTGTGNSTSNWNMTIDNATTTGNYDATIENDFDEAHIIPTTYTKIASFASITDQSIGANLTADFNAYIASSQPASTYTGKVKFVLVHPAAHVAPYTPQAIETTSGKICYYPNTNEHEGTMGCKAISASTTSATLLASNFSREGYGFAGWNTAFDYSGTFYGPNEDITFTAGQYTSPNKGLSLYAVWVEAEPNVTMQTFDDTVAPYSTAPNGTVIALKDIRDNDVYAVAKLADGNWWMIENLRLDYDANITTSNTQSNNGAWGDVFAGLAEPETANFENSTTANSLYTTDVTSTSLRVITGSSQGYRFPRYNNDNTASRTNNNNTPNTNVYSYGNYYTWSAAAADTTYYFSPTDQFITSTSLCPTGWHLPKGGTKSNESNNEWWSLTVNGIMNGTRPANYDSTTGPDYHGTPDGSDVSKALRAYPNNLVYSGYYGYGGSSVSNRGTYGYYWSSTVHRDSAYHESLSSTTVAPGTNSTDRYYGSTVRCLAD